MKGRQTRPVNDCEKVAVGTFEPGIASREGGHVYEGISGTLRAEPGDNRLAAYFQEKHIYGLDLLAGRGGANYTVDICPTIVRGDRTMHGVVYGADMYNQDQYEEVEPTLGINCGVSTGRNGVIEPEGFGETGKGYWQKGIQTLRAEGENRPSRPSNVVVYGIDQQGGKGQANYTEDVAPTLCSDSHETPHAVSYKKDEND